MLNIRLSRVGKKGHAQYKIVVAEKSSPVKGKFVEQLGSYDPHTKKLIVKNDRVDYWIGNGAACSSTVKNLLIENEIIKGEKVKLTFKKKETGEGEETNGEEVKEGTAKSDENKEVKKDEVVKDEKSNKDEQVPDEDNEDKEGK